MKLNQETLEFKQVEDESHTFYQTLKALNIVLNSKQQKYHAQMMEKVQGSAFENDSSHFIISKSTENTLETNVLYAQMLVEHGMNNTSKLVKL